MIKQIPNMITSLNLISGLLAIMFTFSGDLTTAAMLMALGAFFDFFDGLAARALNVKSEMGKQMDSLADTVSFGVVPGFIMFQLMKASPNLPLLNIGETNIAPYIALLIPVLSIFRLAKFNIDSRQTDSFIGLPTPANSLIIGSLPFIITGFWSIQLAWLNNYYILLPLTLLLSFLLVAELPLFALKFKNFKWKGNELRFSFLLASVVLLAFFYVGAFPIIILVYVLLSVLSKK